MIISYPKELQAAQDLKKIFTRTNKDLARQEKARKMPLPWLRYINLWTQMGDKYYFPIAMFKSKLNKTKEVTKDIVYT